MRSLKDIKLMLSKCGAAIWGTKKEVKELTNIIGDDEIIKFKKLLDEGTITQEEFNKKKKELLAQE